MDMVSCNFCGEYHIISNGSIFQNDLWSPEGKKLTLALVCDVYCDLLHSIWYPGTGVVLDFIES